jgi:LPS-assembly protein
MPRVNHLLLASSILAFIAGGAGPVRAQQTAPPPAPQSDLAGCKVSEVQSATQNFFVKQSDAGKERIQVLTGVGAVSVRVDCDDMQFFADFAEVHLDRHRVVATGNVVFVSPSSRIAAERMEFDTKSRTGVFYNASGMASMGDRVDRSLFGTQEADALFRGREIHKIGPKTYKVVHGEFTTCVQPTPRWQIAAGSVTLELDDHALLKNSIIRVKGVPLMYLPIFYYPIQEDDRATGFLIPTYGTSTFRGQTLSNAFFWAIGRSHDATFVHDWFSKTGQQVGGEYRYVLGGGSQGNARASILNEHEVDNADGSTTPAQRSYDIRGSMNQNLGHGFRARADANYFSSITTQQRYEQNVYEATNRTRRFGGNLTGNWREYVVSSTFERNDIFYPDGAITTTGGLPRVNFSRGERRIGRSPLYFGVNGEYNTILWSTETKEDVTIEDRGLTRMDVNPVLRMPFTRWPFLTFNTSVGWRGTWWNESLDPNGLQISDSLGRRFFDFNARITGPVLTRVFNRPGGGYAEKFKHVIEPTLFVRRVTPIDNIDQIVKIDGTDYIVGRVTQYTYGLNNRLYAKKTTAREILSVSINQSYYTDARASLVDQQYQSSFTTVKPTNYSPVALLVRGSPTVHVQGEFRTEWDPTVHALRTFAATGIVNATHVQASVGWSRRRFLANLPGFDNPDLADHYINASTTVRGLRNRIGGTYAFNYDIRQNFFLQQRYLAYYNAQCCGVAVEYQTFNFLGRVAPFGIPQDRRFNISFTLAGIGTFSNFLGAFGGQ